MAGNGKRNGNRNRNRNMNVMGTGIRKGMRIWAAMWMRIDAVIETGIGKLIGNSIRNDKETHVNLYKKGHGNEIEHWKVNPTWLKTCLVSSNFMGQEDVHRNKSKIILRLITLGFQGTKSTCKLIVRKWAFYKGTPGKVRIKARKRDRNGDG